jgi:hypothetical protein
MVPIYVLNDVVVIDLFEYVMVMIVEYYHAYILLDLNVVMKNLKLLLLVTEMHVQLKMS